jgi:hypothetical protein
LINIADGRKRPVSETDAVIAALRTEHDNLAVIASRLSDQDLVRALARRHRVPSLPDAVRSLALAGRTDLQIDLGFLPTPVSVAVAGRMRLSEAALHSWDARVAFDETAVLGAETTSRCCTASPT